MSCSNAITPDQLLGSLPIHLEPSSWIELDQLRIDGFARATDDFQYIHCDPDAAKEAGLDGTVAHGFLVLSLLSKWAEECALTVDGATAGWNYGFDRVRFLAPVPCSARVRALFSVLALKVRSSSEVLLTVDVTVELEGSEKPCLSARWLALFQFGRPVREFADYLARTNRAVTAADNQTAR